jgi:Putative DNA-binding domain
MAEFETEADLQQLWDNEVAEGILIDYKRDLYGGSDLEKKEFLKDVSSFANTAGGRLIIGMSEQGGTPNGIPGVQADLDAEIRRYESLLRDRMEPRIPGVMMRAVGLKNGRSALVISVPRSWNPPHAVLHNHARLIFGRNSAGAHEASVDEMRAMFTMGATILERARAFQHERMKEIHDGDGSGPCPFSGEGGRIVLHLVPFSAVSSEDSLVDLRLFYQREQLHPLWHGQNRLWGYNADGWYSIGGTLGPSAYVQVFRNGIIESAAGDVRTSDAGKKFLTARTMENQIAAKVADYMAKLSEVGISPPILVLVAGVRMHGTTVAGDHTSVAQPTLQRPELHFPAITLNDFRSREDYRRALNPIFDAIWNAAGYEGSPIH